MPTFRQRPLTWLFVMAVLCLNAAGALQAPEAPWFDGILAGQVLVAGAWPMLGRGHRLAGGTVWITAVLGVTWLASRGGRVASEWRYVLGSALFLATATAVFALFWRVALAYFRPAREKARFQFPVAELFGWTIIVALATTAFRQAIGTHLGEASYSMPLLAMAATTSLMMAAFLAPDPPSNCVAGIVSGLAVSLLYLSGLASWFSWLGLARTDLVTLGFVAAWILVVRLDESSHRTMEPEHLTATGDTKG